MSQGNQQTNWLIKLLGSAALAGLVAVATLLWSIYSDRSEDLAMQQQLANQATQIAKQDIQIDLNAEQNELLSEKATIEVQEANIEEQLRTPFPTNNIDFAPTATALSIESTNIEATRQAIESKQQQIEGTQTTIAQPLPTIEDSVGDKGTTCYWDKDWEMQPDGSYLWVGAAPGTPGCANIGQSGELLQKLRDGESITLIVEVGDIPLGLAICSGNYQATTVTPGETCVPDNPELWPKVSGTLIVEESTGFLVGTGQ